MQTIEITKFGPISHCKLTIKEFLVLTGPQASGKSTIAKSIFFFKNVKNVLADNLVKRGLLNYDTEHMSVKDAFLNALAQCFEQTFGEISNFNSDMELRYYYAKGVEIKVCIVEEQIAVCLSDAIENFLLEIEQGIHGIVLIANSVAVQELKKKIEKLFDEEREIIYIPAGRSMLTVLGAQLNYMYSIMDDVQKRSMDYCTQNYIERVIKIKPAFADAYEKMIKKALQSERGGRKEEQLYLCSNLSKKILRGDYRYVAGEEMLQVSEKQYVKINFASSGQQESVWILNVMFYYLLSNRKNYFIIEEPESHLFPDAQKLMTEFIAAAQKNGNQVLVTTHSPYILGELNNLLYAEKIASQVDGDKLDEIVCSMKRLDFSDMSAYYVNQGNVCACVDKEFQSIENEIIDGASEKINEEYEKMIHLVHETWEEAEGNASDERTFFM